MLWIGTEGGGLQAFDRVTETFTHHTDRPDDAHSLDADSILAIAEDQPGALWVGTYGEGLNRVDPKTGTVTYFKAEPERKEPGAYGLSNVWTIDPDREGTVWIGTDMPGDSSDTNRTRARSPIT